MLRGLARPGMLLVALLQLLQPPRASAERLRFTNWHDKLADRRKGIYENRTQMLTIQNHRELALRGIARHMRARAGQSPATEGTELYEFGVYTGGGLRTWLRMMRREGIRFEGRVWGFDSFEGMPTEDAKYKTRIRQRDQGWLAGGLNAAEQMGVADWETLCATLIRNIVAPFTEEAPQQLRGKRRAGGGSSGSATAAAPPSTEALMPAERVHMIRGFYNESLAGGRRLAMRLRMRPALLIDLDCDLYTSSAQALTFALEAELLVPGTYVYLDDVMPWAWADSQTPPLEQKLAFQEVTNAWGLTWEEVPLNASRRDYASTRPVLMAKSCQHCRSRRANNKGGAGDAAGGGGGGRPPPGACLQPAKEKV